MPKEDLPESPAQRLGRYVRERREARNMTQRQVAFLGKIGLSTVQSIERGEADKPSRQTRMGLARALEWTDDSVESVLRGMEPVSTHDSVKTLQAVVARRQEILAMTSKARSPEAYAVAEVELAEAQAQLGSALAREARKRAEEAWKAGRPNLREASNAELLAELTRRLDMLPWIPGTPYPLPPEEGDDEPAVGTDLYDLAAHTDEPGYVRDYERDVAPDEGA